jgi:hypothetical protein
MDESAEGALTGCMSEPEGNLAFLCRNRDTSCRADDLTAWAQASNDQSDESRSMQGVLRMFPFRVSFDWLGRGGKVLYGWSLALDVGIRS